MSNRTLRLTLSLAAATAGGMPPIDTPRFDYLLRLLGAMYKVDNSGGLAERQHAQKQ